MIHTVVFAEGLDQLFCVSAYDRSREDHTNLVQVVRDMQIVGVICTQWPGQPVSFLMVLDGVSKHDICRTRRGFVLQTLQDQVAELLRVCCITTSVEPFVLLWAGKVLG